jgi:two-component system, LytTR family, response regulator
MINTIIVDDEKHCINRLTSLISDNFSEEVRLLRSFQTADETLSFLKHQSVDLVFLDVQLNESSGFDVLQQFGQDDFDVIFTTAYEKYAIDAFKFSAIDYLLKPVDKDDLAYALLKYERKHSFEIRAKKYDVLFNHLKNIQASSKKICIPTIYGYEFVLVGDIIRCESTINYTTIYLKDKQKLTVAKTLKEFEDMLVEYNFFRIHNSHLINLQYVRSYNKGKGGYVCLTDGSAIEVSIRRKESLLRKMAEM